MNLRDLKYIVEVAREKNFARASAKVFVSQPALSMQIKKLEETLGVEIFELAPFQPWLHIFYRILSKIFTKNFRI